MFCDGVFVLVVDEDVEMIDIVFGLLGELFYIVDIWGDWISVVKEVIGCKGKGFFMLLCKVVIGCECGLDMVLVMILM